MITILWMVLIFMFSSDTAAQSTKLSNYILNDLHSTNIGIAKKTTKLTVRKSAHFSLYLVLGALVYITILDYNIEPKRLWLYSVFVSFLYSVTDELRQLFSRGRHSEVRDVAIDTVGSIIGVLVAMAICKKLAKKYNSALPKQARV
jgi:VanZ family protein